MARERSGRTIAHLVFTIPLTTLREAAEAAKARGAQSATVCRSEPTEASLDKGFVNTLLTAYGADAGEIKEFRGQLAAANLRGRWHERRIVMDLWQLSLMSVESAARIVCVWDPTLVPALLRTPAYVHAVDDVHRPRLSPAGKDRRAALLVARQERCRAAAGAAVGRRASGYRSLHPDESKEVLA
ncbi:DUF5753 domain-containing protein [Streptomyces achromogenes]|uniref:DUF5753 domain-containing protein n=1 Tax=Streptomyces achromogenes TaxID=67255 RepID=A0ABZ1KHU1_STRAH